ncbi:Uncharacterised protein [Neisseria gonorrhoeae]|uniref:Uncharacterized protein n=1 Tax=Neisseria gonorrhoeae TaxID=485 RepID=A0A378VSG1_NEIGO|nr:Uncharacterised protein [Neisseria gonorrhoeae]
MAKALEIISPDEIYSDLIFKDPVPPHTIYTELMKLVGRNAGNERIADRAFDFSRLLLWMIQLPKSNIMPYMI